MPAILHSIPLLLALYTASTLSHPTTSNKNNNVDPAIHERAPANHLTAFTSRPGTDLTLAKPSTFKDLTLPLPHCFGPATHHHAPIPTDCTILLADIMAEQWRPATETRWSYRRGTEKTLPKDGQWQNGQCTISVVNPDPEQVGIFSRDTVGLTAKYVLSRCREGGMAHVGPDELSFWVYVEGGDVPVLEELFGVDGEVVPDQETDFRGRLPQPWGGR